MEAPKTAKENSESKDTSGKKEMSSVAETPAASVTPIVSLTTAGTPVSNVLASGQKRRSSTRSIKRKKFDDELVESSLTPSQPKIEKIIKAKVGSEGKSSSVPTTHPVSTPATTTIATSSCTVSTSSSPINKEPQPAPTVATTTTTLIVTTKCGSTSTTTEPSVSTPAVVSTAENVTTDVSLVTPTTIRTMPLTISVPALEKAAAELEASSITPTEQPSTSSPVPDRCVNPSPSLSSSLPPSHTHTPTPVTPTLPSPSQTTSDRKKGTKGSSSKRSKKSAKPPPAASTKDLGRWKPQDDLLLVTAVQQTSDLTAVYLGCKFSCKFTLREIQERWYALLYDPVLSKLAISAMNQLHPDVITQVQSKALYSKDEENLLGTIASNHFQNSQPNIETFQEMLHKNPTVFHPTRTTKSLQTHWLLMRQYHLLPDQTVQPMPKGDHVLNFSDAEDIINDEELRDVKDEALEHELTVADRRQKKEIRHLESELPKWQVLVDSVTGISPQEFDNQTLAVLRGRLVRYLMRSKEITIGRSTKDNPIDVDLSLEGPAWKISRRQGIIKLKNNGDFYVANEGKRPIYIDGKPITKGSKQKLNNNSVVELSCLRFIFLINQDLINMIRQESQKIPS